MKRENVEYLFFLDGRVDISDENIREFLIKQGITERNLDRIAEEMKEAFKQIDNHIGGFYYRGNSNGDGSISKMGVESFNDLNNFFNNRTAMTFDYQPPKIGKSCWKRCKEYLKNNFIEVRGYNDYRLYELYQHNMDNLAFIKAINEILKGSEPTINDVNRLFKKFSISAPDYSINSSYSIDLYQRNFKQTILEMLGKQCNGGFEIDD